MATEVRIGDLDRFGRYTDTCDSADGASVFRLHNRRARPAATDILTVHQEARMGDLRIGYGVDYFGVDVKFVDNGHSCYYLGAALAGRMTLVGGPNGTAEAHGTAGFVVRVLPETQFLIEDRSERVGAWSARCRRSSVNRRPKCWRSRQPQIGRAARIGQFGAWCCI